MKRFVLKVSVFGLLFATSFWLIFYSEKGGSDPFYLRFTTPPATSLIIGNSRAAQGIIPAEIKANVQAYSLNELLNYSFTLSSSPYGKVYLESIQRKLDSESKNGLFIVTVDPWSIAVDSNDPNNEATFPEVDNYLSKLSDVSSKPNLGYFRNHYQIPYFNILLRNFRPSHLQLHDDGWLEVSVKMDSASVDDRINRQIKHYMRRANDYKFSQARLAHFEKTILYLKERGDVYLVRLPVKKEIAEIERNFMPDFDAKLKIVVEKCNVPLLDLSASSESFQYTDGSHLYKASAKDVTRQIAHWITSQKTMHEVAKK